LRALAVRTDFDRLAALARSADPHVAGLGLTLVRQIRRDPRTRRLLEKLWHGRCPAEVLHEVAWRLLDYEDLPEEMHWEIYRLATRHRRYFLDYALNWYGGSWDRLVESVRDRLRDPGFPAAKTWIYLMLVSGIPGRHRLRPVARCLAARWAKAEHAVTARVAAGILRRSRAGGRR
jgi:hypothetical protein